MYDYFRCGICAFINEVSREPTVGPLGHSLESRQQQPPALGIDQKGGASVYGQCLPYDRLEKTTDDENSIVENILANLASR